MANRSQTLRLIVLWAIMRVWLSVWILFCSTFFRAPTRPPEPPLWPPEVPLTSWIRRLVLEPWDRWDVEHFTTIATSGYSIADGTLSFHPLYPLLGRLVGQAVGGDALTGLFLVSNVSTLMFLYAFERLARLDLPPERAYHACFLFLMFPVGFILFAPYTEPLFLLCGVSALLMARLNHWWLAGLFGGLAVLTRQQGILLLLPLLWELWEGAQHDWRRVVKHWRAALGLLLMPIALVGWVVFRQLMVGDSGYDWRQPYTLLYGLLISPSATHLVPQQELTFPWNALWVALGYPGITNIIDVTLGSFYIVLLVFGARKLWALRPSYAIYAAATVVVSFSLTTGVPYSYMGLARHCLVAFPLVLPLVMHRHRTPLTFWIALLGILSCMALSVLYVWENLWVP